MIDETFTASIVQGEQEHKRRLSINAKAYLQTKLNKLPLGTKLWVRIFSKTPARSDRQNRYYRVYLKNIEEETGNDADYLHEHFKRKYLALPPKDIVLADGSTVLVVTYRSTASLNKTEFSEYLQKIERDTGIPLPDTDEFHYGTREEQSDDIRTHADYPEDYKQPKL